MHTEKIDIHICIIERTYIRTNLGLVTVKIKRQIILNINMEVLSIVLVGSV